MIAFSRITQRSVMFVATLAIVLMMGSMSAFAVPPEQVARISNAVTFAGKCCSLWNETVRIATPTTVVPVVVTWSADVVINDTNRVGDDFLVGLSVNGSPCTAYGSREIPNLFSRNVFFNTLAVNATHQWVVFPGDGLVKGTNVFTLCGGSAHSDTDSISIGLSTLTVVK